MASKTVFMCVRKPLARWGIWLAAALIIGMIGFSRVYLEVHYPRDVIAGYCTGIVWVRLLVRMENQEGSLQQNIIQPPCIVPGSAWPKIKGNLSQAVATGSLQIHYLFRSENRSISAVRVAPAADVLVFVPVTICLFVTALPYRSLLVPLSGRSVAPFRAMPANNPRERE
jgi:hypothetical protein